MQNRDTGGMTATSFVLLAAGALALGLAFATNSAVTSPTQGGTPPKVPPAASAGVTSSPQGETATGPAAPSADPSTSIVPVMTYHHVSPTADNFICVTPKTFRRQMRVLKDGGFTPITARELQEVLDGTRPLPDRPVMITFDDGWANQYRYARPILNEFGFKATYFVYPKKLRGGVFMTPAQVRGLSTEGNEIGSHTWDHVGLIRRSGESEAEMAGRVGWQLTKASDWIEKTTGRSPIAFAYPFGYHEKRSPDIVSSANHTIAFTIDEEPVALGVTSPLLFGRFTVLRKDSLTDFEQKLASRPAVTLARSPQNGEVAKGSHLHLSATLDALAVDPASVEFLVDEKPVDTKMEQHASRVTFTAEWAGKPGYHYLALRGRDPQNVRLYSAWGAVTTD